jgi:hypothetical protein
MPGEAREDEMNDKSAWESLLPEHRSEIEGWSRNGEFYCNHPGCVVSIGKNLKDEKPFLLAAQHRIEHKQEER